jgi:hypothetical protein
MAIHVGCEHLFVLKQKHVFKFLSTCEPVSEKYGLAFAFLLPDLRIFPNKSPGHSMLWSTVLVGHLLVVFPGSILLALEIIVGVGH